MVKFELFHLPIVSIQMQLFSKIIFVFVVVWSITLQKNCLGKLSNFHRLEHIQNSMLARVFHRVTGLLMDARERFISFFTNIPDKKL